MAVRDPITLRCTTSELLAASSSMLFDERRRRSLEQCPTTAPFVGFLETSHKNLAAAEWVESDERYQQIKEQVFRIGPQVRARSERIRTFVEEFVQMAASEEDRRGWMRVEDLLFGGEEGQGRSDYQSEVARAERVRLAMTGEHRELLSRMTTPRGTLWTEVEGWLGDCGQLRELIAQRTAMAQVRPNPARPSLSESRQAHIRVLQAIGLGVLIPSMAEDERRFLFAPIRAAQEAAARRRARRSARRS
jgi:hypothetical protein